MKTATIPPVGIESSFRQGIENTLHTGESLASLVETAVRNEVAKWRVQPEFVRRGMLAIERTAPSNGRFELASARHRSD